MSLRNPSHTGAVFDSAVAAWAAMLLFFDRTPGHGNVLICGGARRSELRRYLCDNDNITAAGTCCLLSMRNWQDVQADDTAPWPIALPDLVRCALSDGRLNGASAKCVWMDVERQPMRSADANGRSGEIAESQWQLSELISRHDCDLVCAYDAAQWSAAELLEIVSFHPNVLNNQRVEPNPFFGRAAQWSCRGDSWNHILRQNGGEISSSLLENCTDFIGIAGLDGTLQYINLAGLRLVGLDNADEARRLSVLDFVPTEDRAAVRDEYWRSVTEKGRWHGEIRFRNFKSGNLIPLLVDWFRIDDQRTGEPVVMATVSRDLTQQKQVEAELRMLNEGLEKEIASRAQALSEANLHNVALARSRADARLEELQGEPFRAQIGRAHV